jgi:xanthine/CO dehydrogenase XdhC/CoxF family maturation factor
MRSPDDIVWGLGLGCNGEVRVLLERIDPDSRPGYLGFLDRCLTARRPGIVILPFSGARVGRHLLLDASGGVEGDLDDPDLREALLERGRESLASGRSAVHAFEGAWGRTEALVEYVAPPVFLVIFGAGSDALPLVALAKRLGWQVAVVDERPARVRPERFAEADRVELMRFEALEVKALGIDPHTAIVVMTHHFLHDLDLLRVLLDSEAPYVGLLGPRQRTENLLAELAKEGLQPTAEQRERLFGPVGLDIGSETPEEIALSALAEIRAVLSGREGGFLRGRPGPLHEWPR